MKKINVFLALFMVTILAIGLTSCDYDYYDGYYDGEYYGGYNHNNSSNLPTPVQMAKG